MFWHALPPELNTARLMAGAGPAPMLEAAAGWEAFAAALDGQAGALAAQLASLSVAWTGQGSERAVAAATPMVAWLQAGAMLANQRAFKAAAQAASYMTALAVTPSLPEIAGNHITHTVLTATNFLGINLVPIGFNEIDYFVRMWNQAGGVMDIYLAETIANTTFEPVEPMRPIVQPEVGDVVSALSDTVEALPVADPAIEVPAIGAPLGQGNQLLDLVGQMGQQLSGPMQQLMQPIQQLTSMASQNNGMGGAGDSPPNDKLGGVEDGQLGLLGASPLSNHPLAGGSGPSAGLGLMHAESLPGAGGTSARTSLMSQLIDKSGQVGMQPAGAGSSAVGGAAPMGGMGHGAQSSAGSSKSGLAAPAVLGPPEDHDEHDGFDDHDDW